LISFDLGGHLFHQNCLQSWLEQDTTCPICRLSLHEETTSTSAQTTTAPTTTTTLATTTEAAAAATTTTTTTNFLLWPSVTLARLATNVHDLTGGNVQRRARNHLFRFDGHRYSSWLPSFTIEINHNFPFRLGRPHLTGHQLATMTQNIQQIFPQIPSELILADLQQTQSMDRTINNIIDRRIHLDAQTTHQPVDTSGSDESSYTSSSSSSTSDIDEPLDADILFVKMFCLCCATLVMCLFI
jgi:E3 ubiquitin-protein ligase AMFR